MAEDGEILARQFHEAYERLAPEFGYDTREGTRAFDPGTPNGRLMIAVCSELAARPSPARDKVLEEAAQVAEIQADDAQYYQNPDWSAAARSIAAAIRALKAQPPSTVGGARPLPEPVASAPLGLYRVHWRSGGSSLAAIGMQSDGSRWLAPTNWMRPAMSDTGTGWADIERLEPISPPAKTCPDCHGEGEIEHPFLPGAYGGSHAIDPPDPVMIECETCDGSGEMEEE